MELLRALGSLIEPPGAQTARLAELLDLGPAPDPAHHTDLVLFQLYPFASVYLDGEGKLGGEARDRIAGFWRALGFEPAADPDHLTVLLASYSHLHELEEGARPDADRERWRRVRLAFLWEHLISWLPVYLDKMIAVSGGFYGRWAGLLLAALSEESTSGPGPEQLPLHLREAPAIIDPRPEGRGEVFLDSLLSPVRSGFILVRDDLQRAGRELDLGVRAGERRYVLKALIGQDGKATLEWLAAEAASWSARHSGHSAAFGPIGDFWSSRAATTADLLGDLASDL